MTRSKPLPLSRPLNLLLVVGEPIGGIRKHIHTIVDAFGGARCQITYLYSASNVDARSRLDLRRFAESGVKLIRLNVAKTPTPGDLWNLLRVRRTIRQRDIHVVHGHGAKGGLYARLAAVGTGAAVVYTPHGGTAHPMYSWPLDILYRAVERFLLSLTDVVIFESAYTSDQFVKRLWGTRPKAWTIIHNGVDCSGVGRLAGRKANEGQRATRVGVFGMLRKEKGQRIAIEALRKLKYGGDAVEMHFFGDGPDRRLLERLAVSLGVADIVEFHGDVPNSLDHMRQVDVILIPSLFESFGYVALEAACVRKFVIASAVGGLKETVQEGLTGTLIAPACPDAIAKAIAGKCFQLGPEKNIVEFLERFSERKMLLGLMGVYERLLKDRS